jgi:hypothetical protein
MPDFTSILAKAKPGFVYQNIKEGQIYVVGVNDSGMSGAKAVGTHELADLEKGNAIVGGRIVILEDMDSADSTATLKVQVNGEDLMPATVVTSLVKGEVFAFDLTGGVGSYAGAAALTVDMVVAVQALTTGKYLLILDIVHADNVLNRG